MLMILIHSLNITVSTHPDPSQSLFAVTLLLTQGGIRGSGFVSGGYLPPAVRGTILDGVVHISDWYGTLLGLAGLDPADVKAATSQPRLPPVDSKDLWPLISGANDTSPHAELPVSPDVLIHFVSRNSTLKLITGVVGGNAGWMGPTYPNASSPDNDPSKVTLDCSASPCLFDVAADPGEHTDIAAQNGGVVTTMMARLVELRKDMFSNR